MMDDQLGGCRKESWVLNFDLVEKKAKQTATTHK